MGIIQSDILTIAEFLSNGKKICIPEFQRPYKWTVKNVIQLLDDVQRFNGETPYRIGTIVLYKNSDGAYQIVDGQQRTITFLLILRAIYTNKLDQLTDLNLKTSIQTLNEVVFSPLFSNEISQSNIQNNYREIERKVDYFEENIINFFFNKCEVTYFVIDEISEAFQFFDSQNARGRDLEPHDLLKAFHLRELDNIQNKISESEIAVLVDTWEEMDTEKLAGLFANFLFRIRGWSKGNSSRYFTKREIPLFKGINLNKIDNYPYIKKYKILDSYIQNSNPKTTFPFQLDQTIINGQYFFEMITHYKKIFDDVNSSYESLSANAQNIMKTLDNYEGKNRTGDGYVRMLFNCSLIYYVDKFGLVDISKAIEKIFIWSYTLRLTYQILQLASVDNYVVFELNLFKKIKEAIYKEEILTLELPLIEEKNKSSKTEAIEEIFIQMKYYPNASK